MWDGTSALRCRRPRPRPDRFDLAFRPSLKEEASLVIWVSVPTGPGLLPSRLIARSGATGGQHVLLTPFPRHPWGPSDGYGGNVRPSEVPFDWISWRRRGRWLWACSEGSIRATRPWASGGGGWGGGVETSPVHEDLVWRVLIDCWRRWPVWLAGYNLLRRRPAAHLSLPRPFDFRLLKRKSWLGWRGRRGFLGRSSGVAPSRHFRPIVPSPQK